ncbi:MAG: DUF4282 domain-containing protein [bacterium]
MKKFFSFERMITPIIIKILFWIGLAASAISGIAVFISILVMGFSDGSFLAISLGLFLGLLAGLIVFAFGALMTRIYAELLILAFRINETLTDIKTILQEK